MPTVRVGAGHDSDDDEEDTEQEKARVAAMASVVIDSAQVLKNASAQSVWGRGQGAGGSELREWASAQADGAACCKLKHYQIRGQELLYRLLDKTFGTDLSDDTPPPPATQIQPPLGDEAHDIRLFGRAPPGISTIVKPVAEAKRRKGRTGQDKDHESVQQHLSRLQAVAVDGKSILEQAENEMAKAKAAGEAAEAAIKQTASWEEKRVASLKAQRGEEWLPSLQAQGFAVAGKSGATKDRGTGRRTRRKAPQSCPM